MKKKFRNRGLPSLKESAIDRRRQVVTGRAKVGGGIPPRLFLWGLAVLVLGGVAYIWQAQRELEAQRGKLLVKQRTTKSLLAPKLLPLRDQVEGYAQSLARDASLKSTIDQIDASVNWQQVLGAPGVYLRLRKEEALSTEAIRKAAAGSLRDGFTSCAFSDRRAKVPTLGQECLQSTECERGEYCNEYSRCQRPSSPFNMRMLYRALSVLSEEWETEVRGTNSDTKLEVLDGTLESITQVDIPIAIEIRQRARYATVVIDEDPPDGMPPAKGDEFESPAERVQRVAHQAWVGVWDLQADSLLAQVKTHAYGELRSAGTRPARGGPASEAARARQANSCAIALEFKEKVRSVARP